jgi:hypothetical protein
MFPNIKHTGEQTINIKRTRLPGGLNSSLENNNGRDAAYTEV